MDISKIQATHLLHELSDCWDGRQRGGPSPSSSQATVATCGSGGNLPPGLPAQAPGLVPSGMTSSVFGKALEVPCPSQLAPKAKKVIPIEHMTPAKRPAPEEDDTAPEIEEIDKVSAPPKKKKKKKDKSRERKESATSENPRDSAKPGTSDVTLVDADAAGAPVVKKKKKKKAKKTELEIVQENLRKQKARELALARYRGIQRAWDFPAVITYHQTLNQKSLDTVNGANHTDFLIEVANTEGSYMGQRNGKERNILTKDRLLKEIAKRAEKKSLRMKDARELFEATFSMVAGMPRREKHTPTLAIRCLMDCDGNTIDSDHPQYGKEQNVGLHGVIHPAAMARVTTKETFDIDGFEMTAKVDHAYCPFCGYSCSAHQPLNNHVRMHFQSILFCGWPGCFYVSMLSQNMLDHSQDEHKMKRAISLQKCKKKAKDPEDEDDD